MERVLDAQAFWNMQQACLFCSGCNQSQHPEAFNILLGRTLRIYYQEITCHRTLRQNILHWKPMCIQAQPLKASVRSTYSQNKDIRSFRNGNCIQVNGITIRSLRFEYRTLESILREVQLELGSPKGNTNPQCDLGTGSAHETRQELCFSNISPCLAVSCNCKMHNRSLFKADIQLFRKPAKQKLFRIQGS